MQTLIQVILRALPRLFVARFALLAILGRTMVSCSTAPVGVPAQGSPVKELASLYGTWLSAVSKDYWAASQSVIRFNPDGTGVFINHANFSSQSGLADHWTTSAAFQYWQGQDSVRFKMNEAETLSGSGSFGWGTGWASEAPLWMENGSLVLGRKYDQNSKYTKAPYLEGKDLIAMGQVGQFNPGQRGTGAGFYDTLSTLQGGLSLASSTLEMAQSVNQSTSAGTRTSGGYGVRSVSASSPQAIQQAFGSEPILMDLQLNRGTEIVRVYGMPKSQAEVLLKQSSMMTASDRQDVNKVLRTYRVESNKTYKVGIEKVR